MVLEPGAYRNLADVYADVVVSVRLGADHRAAAVQELPDAALRQVSSPTSSIVVLIFCNISSSFVFFTLLNSFKSFFLSERS